MKILEFVSKIFQKLDNFTSTGRFQEKPKVLIISGPTGSGKSDLALNLARKLNGEIINGDSVQLYSELNIGSNKSIAFDVPHHLFNVISIKDHPFPIINHPELCRQLFYDITKRKKIPIVVGGSSFLIQNLLYNGIHGPPSNISERQSMSNI